MEAVKKICVSARAARLGYAGKFLPLSPLSFDIPQGRISTLIGPNGAGKSTLLRAIVGERFLLSGNILLGPDQQDSRAISPKRLSELVAFIPKELIYPGHLSVRNTLRSAFLSRQGWFGKTADSEEVEIESALQAFGLTTIAEKSLGEISSGERQRVFLGRGFLQPASILIWDEPTNHLDPRGTELFSEALMRAQGSKQRTLLLATHDERLVGGVSDWVVAMNKAGLFYSGPLESSGPAKLFQDVFGLTPSRK